MTEFTLFLLKVVVVTVACPVAVFCSVKLGVIGYHVGTRKAAEVLRNAETHHAG